MADYYPLIARAVSGLDKNTGENRRALYDRARVALVAQLRGVQPALEESDITRERLALEEAIRKVEAETAKRVRADTRSPKSLRCAIVACVISARPSPRPRASAVRRRRPNVPPTQHMRRCPLKPPRIEPHISTGSAPVTEPTLTDEAPPATPRAAPSSRPAFDDDDDTYTRPARSYVGLIKVAMILLVVAGIAGAIYWQRHTIGTMVAQFRSQPAQKPKDTSQPAVRPKIADRIGQSGTTAPNTANAPAAAVAQKVVLYDEDASDPQGKRYVGSALWRTETISPGPGLAPELAIRADIEIPERKLRMTWSLRRNTDKALPASHTIEIMFTLPADFPEGGINNVPGVLMKQDEQARGVPLAGLAVKVTNGYFLIGLSAVDVDVQRNIQLLKERGWFDIPLVYTSGKRAILALEKGTPGTRAFEEAFRAWGQ